MAEMKQRQQKHEATTPSPPEIDPEALIGDLTVGQLLHVLGAEPSEAAKSPVSADIKVEALTLRELMQILSGFSPKIPTTEPGIWSMAYPAMSLEAWAVETEDWDLQEDELGYDPLSG